MRKLFYATAAALALATPLAAEEMMVKDVDVSVDLSAIKDVDAAQNWSNIEGDLETAIVEQLVNRIDDDGASIVIDVDELELANLFETNIGLENSKLSGDVEVKVPGLLNNEEYKLTVTAGEAKPYFPADMDITVLKPTSDEFYTAMVQAFAKGVAESIE